MPMCERTCATCSKKFQSRKTDSDTCYDCALSSITKGQCPEEGDFNTALLRSGEMTDNEAKWLREDLESVERGGSGYNFDPDYHFDPDEQDYDED